jgi:DNA-binding NarL/FixJ family response regulator
MNAESGTPTRILLVDDHEIIRLGVRQLLANLTDLSVCGEADTVQDALSAVDVLRPDLVVVELSIGDGDGLNLIRRLRTLNARLPVVVFSTYEESTFAEVAFMAGAHAYVMKVESPGKLVRAMREALAITNESPPPEEI